MKKLFILSILLMLLVACGSEDPTPEATAIPEATAVPPTATPAESTGSSLDSMEHTPDSDLMRVNWQWERREQNGTVLFEVNAEQGEYLLYFKEDNTFSVGLDCNHGSGNYATASNGTILMELAPMTLADCGAGSFGDEMMDIFDETKRYTFEEDGAVLVISPAYGDTSDYYRSVPAAELPGASGDGATGTVTAPDGRNISIVSGPTTMVYCGDSSQDTEFWEQFLCLRRS